MRKRALVIAALVLATGTVAACGPEGQPCKKGSMMSQKGKIYHCKKDATGNYVWKKD